MAKISMATLTANLKAAEQAAADALAAKAELETNHTELLASFNEKQNELAALDTKLATAQRGFAAAEATVSSVTSAGKSQQLALIVRIDSYVAAIIITLNKVRQVRDNNWFMWKIVPSTITAPIDAVFNLVEQYEKFIGRIKEEINNG